MRRLGVVLAIGLCGCNTSDDNPFLDGRISTAIPPGAALVFTSNAWTTEPGAPRELFAAGADGSAPTRITFCNDVTAHCDYDQVAVASDRNRSIARRLTDRDGDGVADLAELVYVDLARSVEATVLAAGAAPTGVDWSPLFDVILFSARAGPASPTDDIFRMNPNGTSINAFTSTTAVSERRPRIDPQSQYAAMELAEEGVVSRVGVFIPGLIISAVTTGGPPGDLLAGSAWRIGSDTDPAFSPDSARLVFRRLTGAGDRRGTWDLYTIPRTGGEPAPLLTGPAFRSAPDWGPRGILFGESDPGSTQTRLVVIQPDGTGRQVLLTLPGSIDAPRWLAAP